MKDNHESELAERIGNLILKYISGAMTKVEFSDIVYLGDRYPKIWILIDLIRDPKFSAQDLTEIISKEQYDINTIQSPSNEKPPRFRLTFLRTCLSRIGVKCCVTMVLSLHLLFN